MLGNRYRVETELGRGAMGVVYRVVDTLHDDRPVALKTIQSDGPVTDETRLRFAEEFRAMAKLRHPNLVEVYDYGQLDDRTQYLTMEIVPGRTLAELVAHERPTMAERYGLLIQLLQALEFVHARHFVHRDIKPENIRVTPEGRLVLMDFGLMSQLGLPATGEVLSGTPAYLAPEVLVGGVVNATTDLYSVGCLAYELVAGTPPFNGKPVEVLRAHASSPPPALGGEAPARFRALVSRLLAKDQARRYQSAAEVVADLAVLAGVQVARQNLDQKKSYLACAALVGRDDELARLRGAYEAAKLGRGAALFVGAPAGVGKSRLVQEFLLHAKLDGATIAHGFAHEHGMAPYELLATTLKGLAATASTPPSEALGALLAGPTASEAPPDKLEVQADLVAWLGAIAASRPLVVCLEDLHWADAQSVEAFNHLARGVGSLGMVCLATYRPDEVPAGHPIDFTIDEGTSTLLKLAPFDADQTMTLVRAALQEIRETPGLAGCLYEATAGNAFFLFELLRHLMEEGVLVQQGGTWHFPDDPGALALPHSVDAVVARRLGRLAGPARELARRAAVIGAAPPLPMLAALADLPEEGLFAALDELVEGQFLVRVDGEYAFPHARVREALYAATPLAERQALHARCGGYLEAHAGTIEALAHHFSRTADTAKAYNYLRRAGSAAEAAGAESTAVAYWRQAEAFLDVAARPDEARALWWDIGFAAFVNEPRVGIDALEKLVASADAAGAPPDELAPALHLLSVAYGFSGQPRKGLANVAREMALLDDSESPFYAAVLIARVSNLLASGRIDEVVADAREAATILGSHDLVGAPPPVLTSRVGAYSAQNMACFQGVKPDAALRYRALWAATQAGDDTPFTVLVPDAVYPAYTGRYEAALAGLDAIAQKCRKIGAPPHVWALYLGPYLQAQRGAFDDALAAIERAWTYPHLAQADATAQLVRALEGDVRLALGQLEAAEALFEAVRVHAESEELYLPAFRAIAGLGRLALARGDLAAAGRWLETARAMASEGPARNPLHQTIAGRLLGELAMLRGDFALARREVSMALAIAASPAQDNPLEQGLLHLTLGAIAHAQGDRAEAREAYAAAEKHFVAINNPMLAHAAVTGLERAPVLEQRVDAAPPARDIWAAGSLSRHRFGEE